MNMPPILQQLQRQGLPGNLGQIKQMIQMVKSARNPQAMMNQLIQSNPNLKNVMQIVNQSGGDPQKAFYELAKQKGINPSDILDMLK